MIILSSCSYFIRSGYQAEISRWTAIEHNLSHGQGVARAQPKDKKFVVDEIAHKPDGLKFGQGDCYPGMMYYSVVMVPTIWKRCILLL